MQARTPLAACSSALSPPLGRPAAPPKGAADPGWRTAPAQPRPPSKGEAARQSEATGSEEAQHDGGRRAHEAGALCPAGSDHVARASAERCALRSTPYILKARHSNTPWSTLARAHGAAKRVNHTHETHRTTTKNKKTQTHKHTKTQNKKTKNQKKKNNKQNL